jgi:hypothetical protein
MVRRDRLPGQFDPSGRPIAMPSGAAFIPSEDALEPLVISETPAGRPIYSKTRKDERYVSTRFNNVVVDSDYAFTVIDEYEAGALHSVNVVTDNPYAQVYLEIDDFRNREPDGECAAELLYQANLAMVGERRFRAIDGGSPSIGYSMLYEPSMPEEYTRRIRLVIRNNIKRSKSVYGADLSYSSKGSLPTPATCGHIGGSAFHSPNLAAVTRAEMGAAMASAVGTAPYFSAQTYNLRALGDRSIELASSHPYIGIAGTPSLQFNLPDQASYGQFLFEMVGTNSANEVAFGCKFEVEEMPEKFPGSTTVPQSGIGPTSTAPTLSNMTVIITPDVASHEGTGFGDGGTAGVGAMAIAPVGPGDASTMAVAAASTETNPLWVTMSATENTIIGQRFWFRNAGSVYFPGEITQIQRRTVLLGGATATNVEYEAASLTGGGASAGNPVFAYRITIEPGLTVHPEPFMTQLPPGGTPVLASSGTAVAGAALGAWYADESYGWGIVTAQSDSNPHILIKKVEVRRYKKVSFEG